MPTQGLDYLLPDNRYLQPQQQPVDQAAAQQQQGGQPFAIDPAQELANVEGMTDKYYNLKGQVEAFALDAQKKYGVDVTSPSYGEPGGGLLFKTYNRLATQLMLASGDLKEQMTKEKFVRDNVASGNLRTTPGYDPSKKLITDEDYYSTKLFADVDKLQGILDTAVHNKGDFDKFTVLKNNKISELTKRRDASQSQSEKAQIQLNIDSLEQMPQTRSAADDASRYRPPTTSTATVETTLLRDMTALKSGSGDGWEESLDEDGNSVKINISGQGDKMGSYVPTPKGKGVARPVARTIDRWQILPDNQVWLFFQEDDPESPGSQLAIRVDNMNAFELAKQRISSNRGNGSTGNLAKAGILEKVIDPNTGQSLDPEILTEFQDQKYSPEYVTKAKKRAEVGKIIDAAEERRASNTIYRGESDPITLPDGSVITIKTNYKGSGFYIPTMPDIGQNLTKAEILDYLDSIGSFGTKAPINWVD
jgi:hypothetical protein